MSRPADDHQVPRVYGRAAAVDDAAAENANVVAVEVEHRCAKTDAAENRATGQVHRFTARHVDAAGHVVHAGAEVHHVRVVRLRGIRIDRIRKKVQRVHVVAVDFHRQIRRLRNGELHRVASDHRRDTRRRRHHDGGSNVLGAADCYLSAAVQLEHGERRLVVRFAGFGQHVHREPPPRVVGRADLRQVHRRRAAIDGNAKHVGLKFGRRGGEHTRLGKTSRCECRN